MWQYNGIEGNSQIPTNFTQAALPVVGSGRRARRHSLDQQYLPQQLPLPNIVQPFGGFMNNGYNFFQLDNNFQNDAAFYQNQQPGSFDFQFPPLSFHPNQLLAPLPPRPPQQINARAAELKALLLAKFRRASPALAASEKTEVPINQAVNTNGSLSSLGTSSNFPLATAEINEQETSINELISEYAGQSPDESTSVERQIKQKTSEKPTPREASTSSTSPTDLQALFVGSPTSATKPVANRKQAIVDNTGFPKKSVPALEDGKAKQPESMAKMKVQDPKQTQPQTPNGLAKAVVLHRPKSRNGQDIGSSASNDPQKDLPSRRAPPTCPKAALTNRKDDSKSQARPYGPEHEQEKPSCPGPEKKGLLGSHGSRNGASHTQVPTAEQRGEETDKQIGEKVPHLQQLLNVDANLREWLEITGYHDSTYRNKILNRRRAIAALDAQRERLVAEIEAEERGYLPISPQASISSILPPALPNKGGGVFVSASGPDNPQESNVNRVVSNKRSYSNVQDLREETSAGKIPRFEDRGNPPRSKENDEGRHPHKSNGVEASHWSPLARRDTNEDLYYEARSRSINRGRSDSMTRDLSPYSRRPLVQTRSYDEDDYDRDYHHRDHFDRNPRPFEIHGRYKGRAFDPNYRGRGRGRACEDLSTSETKHELPLSSRITSGKLLKAFGGSEKGGKGPQ